MPKTHLKATSTQSNSKWKMRLHHCLIVQEKLKNKLSESQKEQLKDALKDTQDWLDKNQQADREDYEEELRELEKYHKFLNIQDLQPHYPGGQ